MESENKINSSADLQFLSGGGLMGKLIREFNWEKSVLGCVKTWPLNLTSSLSICLNSNFPIAIYWGKDLTLLYNEAWSPIPGNKHPWALGRPAKEVWPEIWSDIEPLFKETMSTGKPTGSKDALLPMERKGFVEECYFDFTFTPIYNDKGIVDGILNAAIETSYRVIDQRRTDFLTDVALHLSKCQSVNAVYGKLNTLLTQNLYDLPFCLVYALSGQELGKVLAGSLTGEEAQSFNIKKPLPLKEVSDNGGSVLINRLEDYVDNIPQGPWPEKPNKGVLLPVKSQSGEITGIIFCGLSSRNIYDKDYEVFLDDGLNIISTALNNISSIEAEKKRVEMLEGLDKAKTVFFNNISHEFRTPLTLMLGPLEELLHHPSNGLKPETLQKLETTHRNALRLLKLVNTLLDFSRIESGKQKPQFSLVDIAALTKSLASNFQSVIEKAGLQFHVKADTVIRPVYVDMAMWEKIVFNLLSNAFKYTLKGSITVSLWSSDKNVILEVSDTGIGIPEKEMPRMFERFHRIEGANGRTHEGTGIGLSMIKELVNLHGGTIEVKSKEGEGTKFTVTIPTGKEHLAQTSIVKTESLPYEDMITGAYISEAESLVEDNSIDIDEQSKETERSTILVVDDNADMRAYLKSLLEHKYNVISASNGLNALHQIQQSNPDVVVSDIMMPVMDGIQLVKEIKGNSQTSMLPIILLSARAGEEAKMEGFDIGADDYLVKPFSAKELLVRIQSQLKLKSTRHNLLKNAYTMFDDAPFTVAMLIGPSLRIEYINNLNLRIWQKTKDDVMGKDLLEIFPGNKKYIEQVHGEVYRTGKRYSAVEVPIEILDNDKMTMRWFSFVIDPMKDDQGTIVGQIATSIDVTEQVLAKKKLEQAG